MSLPQILLLVALPAIASRVTASRSLFLLGVNTVVVYWLQPFQEPAGLVFWLPTVLLAMAVICWAVTTTSDQLSWERNGWAAAVITGSILLVNLSRHLNFDFLLVADTPRIQWAIVLIVGVGLATLVFVRVVRRIPGFLWVISAGILIVLLLIKLPVVAVWLTDAAASLRGKDTGASGLSWLGYSYVSFRLLHTLFDRIAGRLPSVGLADYVNYVMFFPSFTAGPIDRLERFIHDLNQPFSLDRTAWLEGGGRLIRGLFKKFVLADALAWFVLNESILANANSTGWIWLLIYAYSFRIYFDFSGYTDIAIGLGKLFGITLPENFHSPYLKSNLSQFWNSWHMTLTQWFRSYFFNPVTRALRSTQQQIPTSLVIFLTQVSTMALIGLWHGITVNYLLWGVWHGLGLFIQNRWSAWMRSRYTTLSDGRGQMVLKGVGIFLTFHFVSLGWLFFIFSEPESVWSVLGRLTGIQ